MKKKNEKKRDNKKVRNVNKDSNAGNHDKGTVLARQTSHCNTWTEGGKKMTALHPPDLFPIMKEFTKEIKREMPQKKKNQDKSSSDFVHYG